MVLQIALSPSASFLAIISSPVVVKPVHCLFDNFIDVNLLAKVVQILKSVDLVNYLDTDSFKFKIFLDQFLSNVLECNIKPCLLVFFNHVF